MGYRIIQEGSLAHYGILGMKWGVRRYQNADGSLTAAGKKRYYNSDGSLTKSGKVFYGRQKTTLGERAKISGERMRRENEEFERRISSDKGFSKAATKSQIFDLAHDPRYGYGDYDLDTTIQRHMLKKDLEYQTERVREEARQKVAEEMIDKYGDEIMAAVDKHDTNVGMAMVGSLIGVLGASIVSNVIRNKRM